MAVKVTCLDCGGVIEYGKIHDCPGHWPPDPNTGWLCPRCKKVNAPHVRQCDCEPDAVAIKGFVPETYSKAPISGA